MNLSPQFIAVISATLLIFLGYLNTCTSNHHPDVQESIPKIWPNISDNHSFLQFPGLTGSGGLDFSFYDAFAKIVNKTRGLPSKIAPIGNYTLLQVALMAAIGGLITGVAVLLSEAAVFKKYHKEHDDLLIGAHGAIAYGAPPIAYGAPSPPSTYGAPSPPSTYGAPSPPSTYGAPSPPSTYGAPSPPSTYGAPSPPSTYGAPSPPSTYGSPSPPSTYGSPSPPSTYGSPSPPSTYGAPSPPSEYGAPNPPSEYGAP